jgi:hypothetical protein
VARKLALVVPPAILLSAALWISYTADFGLAYRAGVEAWNSGHPQRLLTWTGTPFYAVLMAAISRIGRVDVAARVFSGINVIVWGALLTSIWTRMIDRVPSTFWWVTYSAAVLFAPAISTIFWLQPNLIVFGLALGGFVLVGRRDPLGGFLIGLSIALKPIVILLPLALLLRRQTREAGIWAIATTAVLSIAGLGFLAWRAGDPSVLNPIAYLAGFLSKGRGPIAACVPENYSPVALLCRLGVEPSTTITIAVAAAVLLIGWLLLRRLPDLPEARWEVFAVACLLSGMLGPIDWASYGVLMAPLFLLLAYQFWRESAPPPLWIGLGLAFLLAELVWDPLESLAQTPVPVVVFSYTAGQFSQYVLLFVWARWRQLRRASVWSSALRP